MTLEEAEAKLARYENAMDAIVERGQSYEIEGRTLKRADLPEVRNTIDWLERKIARLKRAAGGGSPVRYV